MFRSNEAHRQQDIFGLESRLPRRTWELLKESQEYAFYEEIVCRIPEPVFAELYDDSPATRPNAPVNRLVGALILQHMRDWTFEELMDRLAFDLKVRAALGLWALEETAFCRTTLFNFQNRVREHMGRTGRDVFACVFDLLTGEQLERFGLKDEIQRCDSTQVGSNIRVFTRIELLVEVVLRTWRALGEAGQARYAEPFELYVKAKTSGQFLYRLRRSEFETAVEKLGEFYAWMVEALKAEYGETEITPSSAASSASSSRGSRKRSRCAPGKRSAVTRCSHPTTWTPPTARRTGSRSMASCCTPPRRPIRRTRSSWSPTSWWSPTTATTAAS